jgi:cytochrome c6
MRRVRCDIACDISSEEQREVNQVKQRSRKPILYIAMPVILLAAFSLAVAMTCNAGASATAGGDARSVYNSKCASCHGRDGRATSARARREHARDMTPGEWQDSVSDERIYNSISNGKGKMPAFKKKLSDAQIDELVNYVRRLRR